MKVESPINKWMVNYNASIYPGGTYRAQVVVKRCVIGILCYEIGSARSIFAITGKCFIILFRTCSNTRTLGIDQC